MIILEQTRDPQTHGAGPADPALRQAVRLTGMRRLMDDLYQQPLLEVRWAPEDALGFDLAVTAGGHPMQPGIGERGAGGQRRVAETEPIEVSAPALTRAGLGYATPFPDPQAVARHQARGCARSTTSGGSRSQSGARRPAAAPRCPRPSSRPFASRSASGNSSAWVCPAGAADSDRAARAELEADALAELLARADRLLAGRRRRLESLAWLAEGTGPLDDVLIGELAEDWGQELTAALAAGQPGSWGPAAIAITQDPRAALPVLQLADGAGGTWAPALDLIGAAPTDRVFVAEVNDQGIAGLRINDPPAATTLSASYWVGNGTAGNAEIEAINALVWTPSAGTATASGGAAGPSPPSGISLIRNPLAATGGIDAETISAAKLAIPGAFTAGQQRALTAADYAALATVVPGVRRAAAELRFTGSLPVVDVAIQPELGEDPAGELLAEVRRSLSAVRKIGQLVRVLPPRYRPLVVALDVTLSSATIRREVAHHLARLLSSGWLPDGTPALFNPANLAFATPVYSSPIIAAVHAVAGVDSVTLARFGFLDQPAAAGSTAVGSGAARRDA